MKIGMWGEMSLGEMSFGGKHRTCANFGKKWEEMSGGETSLGEKRHLGKNVFPPNSEFQKLSKSHQVLTFVPHQKCDFT